MRKGRRSGRPFRFRETKVLVMILLPFIAYLGAEHIGASVILAAVTAGLLTGGSGVFRFPSVSACMRSMSLWTTLSCAGRALFTEITLTEALLKGGQARK
ncbi:cation:proton antiporter [Mesorhizobium calcicola]|uniref:Cation:proton antiporter n=1 Tax=Mesorhizobium calcicola TaxID=1300310 RepID=A0ABW4WTU6_9HYPH